MNKPTLRLSGRKMLTVTVAFHLGIDEMTLFCHRHHCDHDKYPTSRKALVDYAKNQIGMGYNLNCGSWDHITDAEVEAAEAAALKLFPEMARPSDVQNFLS